MRTSNIKYEQWKKMMIIPRNPKVIVQD